ncbi:uncharacterized protein LOC131865388 [Cryptomeria japonica]|uniref:uncharacterized protein LOC131865388 n=1 Tax=Cryptomeria japonica TaxID=3369 RepID=UPI0027D9D17A|nr:uncharacterized protein LOC131865388 [Cryptomeria japonica]
MPLFTREGKLDMWKGLLDGCKAKMEGWKSKWLSLAGRILMLKIVVSAMPIFPMACFKLPASIIKNMQQKMRKFLWNGNQDQDKVPLMAWDRVCKPKGGGGVGLRDWKIINEAMGAKLVWQMYSKLEQRWAKILQAKYLDSREKERILTVRNPPRGSALWNFLRRSWKDPQVLNLGEDWERYLSKISGNREVLFLKEEDEIIWCGSKSGCYSVKVGITLLERDAKSKEWESKICWNNVCLLKAGAFAWLAGNKWILSGDHLNKMGFAGPFHYVLCEKAEEDVDHLFLNCDFSQKAWLFGSKGNPTLEWTPPEKGWTKINFDRASRGNLGPSGVGVIARDDRGNILAIAAKRLLDGSNNVTECQAALDVILMARKLGVKKLHLEGDSQVVVGSNEEVQWISSLVLRPKWVGGLQDVVARSVIGVGLRMAEGPSRRIGVDVGELQHFVVWSASRPIAL